LIVPDPSGSSHFLIIDQGTSSTKCFLFDTFGKLLFSDRIKHGISLLGPNEVECDPEEIFNACQSLIWRAQDYSTEHSITIASMGFAVQRSTFLFWDKSSLQPASPALSWQDSRASDITNVLAEFNALVHQKSGVPLSPHFGGAKYAHLTQNDSELKTKAENGEIWFGPLSAYLLHKFTGVPSIDHTIAGRSQLMNIRTLEWDKELINLFEINSDCLPELCPTVRKFGQFNSTPIHCVIGDQQSALIGQDGDNEGFLALNFGTSGSVLMNSGDEPNQINGLLTNVLFSNDESKNYLLEGSINACNSLFYWLESELGIPHEEMKWQQRCTETETNGVLIPGFSGLAAPYWKSGFNTVFYQLEDVPHNEIIRAGMESIGFLVHDILQTMNINQSKNLIPTSGGGAREPLLQFIADITGKTIGHSSMKDRTSFGVFSLLKKAAREKIVDKLGKCDQIFTPKMNKNLRREKLAKWHSALRKAEIL